MNVADSPYSKSQIRKAARRLRNFFANNELMMALPPEEQDEIRRSFEIVEWYRRSFAVPMLKVRMGLKSFVGTCGHPDAQIAQRHKRLPRILAKLIRYPQMQITTMQDIGGCRVVLPTLDAVEELRRHIHYRWESQIVGEDDYIAAPQASGYRAIHVIVRRDDRRIEIQLRTVRQHVWANTVEALSRRLGVELKWGRGPEQIIAALARLADAMADEDHTAAPLAEFAEVLEDGVDDADRL